MIADSEKIPICQDTGMAVVFVDIGQEIHFTGGQLNNLERFRENNSKNSIERCT